MALEPLEGIVDSRVRRLLLPKRIAWVSGQVEGAPNLLNDDDAACVMRPGAALLLDFGRELHGGIRLDVPDTSTRKAARVRIRFGESASEAMGTPNNDHSIHDFDVRAPWMGHIELGNTGFRFVRIDLLDAETAITLRHARAVFVHRPVEYLGSFRCSDPLLNRIWETGAYTVHLCMQDLVWDGIKRDRLPWIGDLHPEAMVISTVFGNDRLVPATLDYVRDRTPLPGWMHGISSYSLWWILIHYDWYLYHGDLKYLKEQRDYLVGLLAHIESLVDASGQEHLDGYRFLEWPTSRDPAAIDFGLQALTAIALVRGFALLRVLNRKKEAARAALAHQRAMACRRAPTASKQANALAVLAGMADAAETNRKILAKDPYRGLSTFYGYYILQARARAGDCAGCLRLIRNYWGGMLKMGATTFWEGFETDWMKGSTRIDELPQEGKRDIHADFGDFCYPGLRHSLCHGWAAGPTAWLTEHVLGLAPATLGFAGLRVTPHLANLKFAEGALPTPLGIVKVRHTRRDDGRIETELTVPKGVRAEGQAWG